MDHLGRPQDHLREPYEERNADDHDDDGENAPPDANIDKIRARGGEVVFLRLPCAGFLLQVEDGGFPRERVWDRLLRDTNSMGIAWQDYPELQGYDLPEWSHLSASEAERYTRALVPIFYRELEKRKAAQRPVQ